MTVSGVAYIYMKYNVLECPCNNNTDTCNNDVHNHDNTCSYNVKYISGLVTVSMSGDMCNMKQVSEYIDIISCCNDFINKEVIYKFIFSNSSQPFSSLLI